MSAPSGRREEMPPEGASTIGQWVLLLAGPTLFMGHFGIVYLAAEASCRAEQVDGFAFFGPGALRAIILAATALVAVVALGMAGAAARAARRRASDDPALAWAGAVLGLGSAVAVLALGLPVLVIDPC